PPRCSTGRSASSTACQPEARPSRTPTRRRPGPPGPRDPRAPTAQQEAENNAEPSASVRALNIARYGGPDVMTVAEIDEPALGPRDVLIDVRAASLNPLDVKFREKKAWPILRPRLPVTLGCDVAGVVRAVGEDARHFAVGDEVFARLEENRMGGLAERVAADGVIDYTQGKVALRQLDGVFDSLGDASELRSLAMVKPGGIVVGVGGLPDPGLPLLPWWARPVVRWRTTARRAAARRAGAR